MFAVSLLVGTSLIGTIGYVVIEGYEMLDAIYQTVITMSTVGYGTVSELTPGGKIFSIFLIVMSAGIYIYAITTITTFVIEGEVKQLFNRYKANKTVQKLSGHIIICGLGRNGREAAIELIRQNQPFVVVENDQSVIDEFMQTHEILAVKGDATHEEVLEEANIHKARGLISSLSTDAENVYITLTARQMCPNIQIAARASHESSISKLQRAGANKVIVPNLIGGRKMVNMITRPALNEFIELVSGEGNPNLRLEVFECKNYPQMVGNTLAELGIRAKTGVLVLGKKRGNEPVELNLTATDKLADNDKLFVMGTRVQLEKFKQEFLE
ncbi:MAG: potassium channel protein [Bacteroidetes bacterium]|nr:potassium channel protein [Bacteroidota bacterium]